MAAIMNDEILLESGTNEIEIMEFTIDGVLYGINVAKVTEIMISAPVKFMPHTHMAVEGIFKPRDAVITVINLPKYLDFEKIVAEIAPETSIQISEIDEMGPRERNLQPIYIAEDSILLSRMIRDALTKAGYTHLSMFPNGRELWEHLLESKRHGTIDNDVSLIVTDIEMPQMDGHRLTKLVKDDPELKHIPVIIFSSLISEEMRIKGEELGANEQLTKPEIGRLVSVMDGLLQEKAAQGETA